MTFQVFSEKLHAINNEIEMPGLRVRDAAKLREIADGFQSNRQYSNPLHGCLGALDGIAVSVRKAPDEFAPRKFYCRKGMYALPVQAVVDSELRFRCMSRRCTGSTHDAAAFDVSELAQKLKDNRMSTGFWLAGDAAYISLTGLLTPWSKSALSGENGVFADIFNFYHSSHRIHVEQLRSIRPKMRIALEATPVSCQSCSTYSECCYASA